MRTWDQLSCNMYKRFTSEVLQMVLIVKLFWDFFIIFLWGTLLDYMCMLVACWKIDFTMNYQICKNASYLKHFWLLLTPTMYTKNALIILVQYSSVYQYFQRTCLTPIQYLNESDYCNQSCKWWIQLLRNTNSRWAFCFYLWEFQNILKYYIILLN